MIKVTLNNEILKKITSIDENRFSLSPIELPPITSNRLRKTLHVTNKTIINRCVNLANHGFIIPNIVHQRIRSYSLSEFAKKNAQKVLSKLTEL